MVITMSRSSLTCKLICTFVLIVLMAEAPIVVVHALTCNDVSNTLFPCVAYMVNRNNMRSKNNCCRGIKSLNINAKTTSDRRFVCNCLKNLTVTFREKHRLDVNLVKELPRVCNANINYNITTLNPNCAQVK